VNSALYVGSIRHRRYFPTPHGFDYPIYMSWIDLDELDQLFRGRWLWSTRGRNIVQYRRSDFLGPIDMDLKQAVLHRVFEKTGERPSGPVRLLTHLRYFGLSFNPVSFYYCYEADGQTLHSIVSEITNTPWRERFAYVLPVAQAHKHQTALHWEFDKQFHVSPFLPMGLHYDWRFQRPDQHLRVHMNVHASDGKKQFDSTLVLGRQELTGLNLARALARFPFITLSVLLKIYWHALLLRFKRNPFYDHPQSSLSEQGKP
jgi:uncharacterized protein